MDIATLGLATRYQDIEGANKALDRFSGAAGQAEKSARSMGTGATDAARRTVAANDNVARSASKLGGVYRRVAAIISGVFASALAAVSLRQFISATVEADQVQAQLAAALRSTAGASGQTIDSLNKHAVALQKVTNFGDEAINSAQGILLTFTRIRGDQFDKVTEAVLNVATAMKTDLKSAAIQVGKALNDPNEGMTALTRSGITFTEAQKEMVKQMVASGDMIGAQTLILKELETQFGGSAKAARDVLGGALTSLRNAWGDLFELGKSATEPLRLALEGLITAVQNPAFMAFVATIGTGLVMAFTLAVKGATALVDGISFISDHFDTIAVAVGSFSGAMLVAFGPTIMAAVGALIIAIGTHLVGAVTALTLAMMRNPFLLIPTAIAIAITAIYEFRDEIKQAIGVDVVQVAKVAGNTIINSFRAVKADAVFIWENFPDIIAVAVIGAVNRVIRGVNTMIQTATGGIDTLIAKLNEISGTNISPIGMSLSIPEISSPAGRLDAANTEHLANIQRILSSDPLGASDVAPAVREGVAGVADAVNSGFPMLTDQGRSIAENTRNVADGLGGVGDKAQGAGERVSSAVGSAAQSITSALSSGFQSLNSVFAAGFANRQAGTMGGGAVGGYGSITGGRRPGTLGGPTSASYQVQSISQQALAGQAFEGFATELQSQNAALSAEAQVLQTALQFRQLTEQERADAEYRLAEISIQQAQNQERLAQATIDLTGAMNSLFATSSRRPNDEATQRMLAGATSAGAAAARSGDSFDPHRSGFAGLFADGGRIPRGQFGVVGERGPEFVRGPADVIPMKGQAAVTHNNDNSRGDVNISVNVNAQDGGGGSRESEREMGRRVAQEAAYHLREMGFA